MSGVVQQLKVCLVLCRCLNSWLSLDLRALDRKPEKKKTTQQQTERQSADDGRKKAGRIHAPACYRRDLLV